MLVAPLLKSMYSPGFVCLQVHMHIVLILDTALYSKSQLCNISMGKAQFGHIKLEVTIHCQCENMSKMTVLYFCLGFGAFCATQPHKQHLVLCKFGQKQTRLVLSEKSAEI